MSRQPVSSSVAASKHIRSNADILLAADCPNVFVASQIKHLELCVLFMYFYPSKDITTQLCCMY